MVRFLISALSVLLMTSTFAQQFTNEHKNAASISGVSVLSYTFPSLIEPEQFYSCEEDKIRTIKFSYYRSLTTNIDLRAGLHYYTNSSVECNGKNIQAYSEREFRYTVIQAGVLHRFFKQSALSPFVDVGIELGRAHTLSTKWESEFNGTTGSGPELIRSSNDYNLLGVTTNLGLHWRFMPRWFVSSSVGLRMWATKNVNDGDDFDNSRFLNVVSQSDILNVGFTF